MNELIARKKQLRSAYLEKLYELSRGRPLNPIDEAEILKSIDIELDAEESWVDINFDLTQAGKIKIYMGDLVSITPIGVNEIEEGTGYVLNATPNIPIIESQQVSVRKEGMFFGGQYFDALRCAQEIFLQAQSRIVIIDGYIGEDLLNLLTVKQPAVDVNILTKTVPSAVKTLATAFNKQHGQLSIRTSEKFHDRFVIVDDTDFYHFGASIKDLGKRASMFSLIEEPEIIKALQRQWNQEWSNAKNIILSE